RLDWSNDFSRNFTRRTSLIQESQRQAGMGRRTPGGLTLACRKVAVDGYSLIGVEREAWSVISLVGFTGHYSLVRAGSPDPPVLCDRRSPCPRPLACRLETSGRPNGDCSLSTTSVNRRGAPSMPRVELVTALPTRRGFDC